MSAGEVVIRKRVAEAIGRDQHYAAYLSAQDLQDLLDDVDRMRMNLGMIAIPEGASIIVAGPDGSRTAATLTPVEEAVLAAAAPQYDAAIDRLLGDHDPAWANDPVRGYSEPTVWRPCVPATPPPEGFKALYVTFGQRYVKEPHETGLPWPHPDGFLTVHYPDVDEVQGTYVAAFGGGNYPRTAHERARQVVMTYLGGHFATSYPDVPTDFVPWGELALLVLP